jgi:phage shock protein C
MFIILILSYFKFLIIFGEKQCNTDSMKKELYRSRTNKKIAGICGGVGEMLGFSPSLLRLILIFITFMTGIFPGVFAYVIAWVVLPEEPYAQNDTPVDPNNVTE